MKRFFVGLVLLPLSLSAWADGIYSCKDASGRAYYAATPASGPGVSCKQMSRAPQASSDAEAARKTLAEQKMADRKQYQQTQDDAAKAEKQKAEAAEKSQQCEKARANVRGIESGQVRYTMSPNGERVAMDDTIRAQELANARKAADSWCK